MMNAIPGRIDIHHHALSAGIIELVRELGLPTPAGQWQLSETLDLMDAPSLKNCRGQPACERSTEQRGEQNRPHGQTPSYFAAV